jgi:hypothetical protein
LAAVLVKGITPIEYMLSVLHDETAAPKDRAWAAEKAAPFVHPRPQPIDGKVQIELPDTSTVGGIDAALDRVIKATASGELSTSQGQSLVALIEARRKAIEMGELEARIKRLEQSMSKA